MENCLVKKLKGSVDNPNLPIFGVVTLNVEYTSGATDNQRKLFLRLLPGSHRFYTNNESTFSVYASDGTTVLAADVKDYTRSTQALEDTYILLSNATYKFYLDKYGFTYGLMYPNESVLLTQKIYSVDVSEFKYTPLVELGLVGAKTSGIFKLKDKTGLVTMQMSRSDIPGIAGRDDCTLDLDELNGCENLEVLVKYGGYVNGSINNLNGCTKIRSIILSGYLRPNPDFTGDLNALAAAQVAAGRTDGQINLSIENSKVTWDGVVVSQSHNPTKIVFDPQATGGYTIQ